MSIVKNHRATEAPAFPPTSSGFSRAKAWAEKQPNPKGPGTLWDAASNNHRDSYEIVGIINRQISGADARREQAITEVVETLGSHGIAEKELSFRGSNGAVTYFTYQGWRSLPTEALEAIAHLAYEDLYEDEDGDDERGRPIIRRMWNYQLHEQK